MEAGGFQRDFLLVVLEIGLNMCLAVVEEGRLKGITIGWRREACWRVCQVGNHERLED